MQEIHCQYGRYETEPPNLPMDKPLMIAGASVKYVMTDPQSPVSKFLALPHEAPNEDLRHSRF